MFLSVGEMLNVGKNLYLCSWQFGVLFLAVIDYLVNNEKRSIMPIDISPEVQQAKLRFGIVGNSPALLAAIGRALQVAPTDFSVLINGESGAGKEFFPKVIHAFSPRKHKNYIAVNCGAIPEGTIDSELFGHEKGAYTGAAGARKGYFEEADGGTIFLDEVAELPLTTQARLLRVLENGEFIKVGSSTVQKTNIRVVAATNVNMQKAIAEGRFREDLYYRLSTVRIAVPPLRDRGNDILLLTRKFSSDFAEKYRMPLVEFDDDAKKAILTYRWPGNVRQLKNVIEQISLFDAGKKVSAEEVASYFPDAGSEYSPAVASGPQMYSYDQEREGLFKILFEMRKDINDLKETVASLSGVKPAETVANPLQGWKRDGGQQPLLPRHHEPNTAVAVVENTDPEPATAMTLEDTERETIRRSLERNVGNRKKTAEELQISERTLYRKIKEYGLENKD